MSQAGPPPGPDDPTQGGEQPSGWAPPAGPPAGQPPPGGPPPGQPPPAGPPPGQPPPAGPPPGQWPAQQPYPQYGQYAQPPPYGGWQQPYGWTPMPKDNTKATASLILGIAGLVICPLICSIIALVLGYQARREIDESNGMEEGHGNAVAGIVLGWIGVGLSVLGIAFFVVLAIVADDTTTYDDYGLDGLRFALRAATACARFFA